MSQLIHIFCDIDDFCKSLQEQARDQQHQMGQRRRQPQLCLSEIMTLLVYFHRSAYRNFKAYYTDFVLKQLRPYFPNLVSYNRFVELMPRVLLPLCLYLNRRKGKCTGIAFVDATSLSVCHNRRINRHRVFEGLAARGKTSMGWFYGFKLHLMVNDCGEILAVHLTPGNVDDRVPVTQMAQGLFGKLFADRGYIAQWLHDQLFDRGVELITKIRKNMKQKLLPLWDKLMLRRRSIIETINDQLKNISQIEHTRHRSVAGFLVNVLSGLIAYTYQQKKPSLGIIRDPMLPILAL